MIRFPLRSARYQRKARGLPAGLDKEAIPWGATGVEPATSGVTGRQID
jgi:hypothetical protein